MPRTLVLAPHWADRLQAADAIATGGMLQLLGFTPKSIYRRVELGQWQRLLPGVYCCHSGTPTRRQLVAAAQRWAGQEAAIDGVDSCHFHGLSTAGYHLDVVHFVAPAAARIRSRDWVVVRRTERPIRAVETSTARYLVAADAVIAAAVGRSVPSAVSLMAEAIRRRLVTESQLVESFAIMAPHGSATAATALQAIVGGARSAPEATMRELMLATPSLPRPMFNPSLLLPGNRIVVPDALLVDAAVIHEVNGRRWHAGEDRFESMQERHDAMTAAGLILLHNSPRRIERSGATVMTEIEQTYRRYAGRGLPAGVRLLLPTAERVAG